MDRGPWTALWTTPNFQKEIAPVNMKIYRRSGYETGYGHLTLTLPPSTQVYKFVPAKLILGGNPVMEEHPIQAEVEILLVASCYRNQDKLRLMSHLAHMPTLPVYKEQSANQQNQLQTMLFASNKSVCQNISLILQDRPKEPYTSFCMKAFNIIVT